MKDVSGRAAEVLGWFHHTYCAAHLLLALLNTSKSVTGRLEDSSTHFLNRPKMHTSL